MPWWGGLVLAALAVFCFLAFQPLVRGLLACLLFGLARCSRQRLVLCICSIRDLSRFLLFLFWCVGMAPLRPRSCIGFAVSGFSGVVGVAILGLMYSFFVLIPDWYSLSCAASGCAKALKDSIRAVVINFLNIW